MIYICSFLACGFAIEINPDGAAVYATVKRAALFPVTACSCFGYVAVCYIIISQSESILVQNSIAVNSELEAGLTFYLQHANWQTGETKVKAVNSTHNTGGSWGTGIAFLEHATGDLDFSVFEHNRCSYGILALYQDDTDITMCCYCCLIANNAATATGSYGGFIMVKNKLFISRCFWYGNSGDPIASGDWQFPATIDFVDCVFDAPPNTVLTYATVAVTGLIIRAAPITIDRGWCPTATRSATASEGQGISLV
jgi:hypothetical protein